MTFPRSLFQFRLLALWLFVLLAAGCATVPPEAVDLSTELTGMIMSARKAHLALLDQYIAERRKQVNVFIETKWTPQFMENAFHDTGILDSLKAVGRETDKRALLQEFLQDAEAQIVERRTSMLDAIDAIGTLLEREIRAHYDDMLTVNQALTAHLQSAADITESRKHLAETLKIDTRSILPMDKIDSILEDVARFKGKSEELEKYVERVRSILKGK